MTTLSGVRGTLAMAGTSVRRVPTIRADQMRCPVAQIDASLWLKLDYVRVTGAFKANGPRNRLFPSLKEMLARGIAAASNRNGGFAAMRAVHLAGVCATAFLPGIISRPECNKLLDSGAEVWIVSRCWGEANAAVESFTRAERRSCFRLFLDPALVAGVYSHARFVAKRANSRHRAHRVPNALCQPQARKGNHCECRHDSRTDRDLHAQQSSHHRHCLRRCRWSRSGAGGRKD